MKKTLAALAALGAFAGSTLAADVQLYGIVDTGIGYNHIDMDGVAQDKDKFQMQSGQASDSRFGFKGTEDLGNGLTVGFVLENGIKTDTGVDDGVFFNRESSLFIQGSFGKLAVGHIGSLNSGTSSWCLMPYYNAFATAQWGGYSAQVRDVWAVANAWDNMIAYQTPEFAGLKFYAQYAMGNQAEEADGDIPVENESSSDRYYAVGATYRNGPIDLYFAVDSQNYKSWDKTTAISGDVEDSLTVTLAGSYKFDAGKIYLGAQYFDEVKLSVFGGVLTDAGLGQTTKMEGYSVSLTGDTPVAGGKIMAGLGYIDAESADSEKTNNVDFKRYVASVGYDYPFSKRTDVYAVASYMQDQYEDATLDVEPSAYTLYIGLRHRF